MAEKKSPTQSRLLALKLRLHGLSYAEIGKQLGISRQRAQQLIKPPSEIYKLIKKREKSRCQNCGIYIKNGHLHHKEVSKEFSAFNEIQNLEYLCRSCHTTKHDLGSLAILRKWVRQP